MPIRDIEKPQQAEIDENTCRKDFTPQEIYEITKYYNEKLSKQGNNQYTDSSIFINDKDAPYPIEVVAKVVHKGVATVSKINQIFESDFIDIQEKANEGATFRFMCKVNSE